MAKILLLYDTKEKDLARDIEDFLRELGLEVKKIPTSPDKGRTLQEKEELYFKEKDVDGAIFLITPGSIRDDKPFPSPSVSHEMGQAQKEFSGTPERVIYLVEDGCTLPAIDQKCYTPFNKSNMRSVLEAITHLVKNLKDAGLIGKKKIEPQVLPGVNIEEYSKKTPSHLKNICEELSEKSEGILRYEDFEKTLKIKFQMKDQDINFAKRDLLTNGLVSYHPPKPPYNIGMWQLTPLGFELVRYEINLRMQKKREELARSSIFSGLMGGKTPAIDLLRRPLLAIENPPLAVTKETLDLLRPPKGSKPKG